jgi:DNA-binding transcriptional regulator YdaS (Cro superfamily)
MSETTDRPPLRLLTFTPGQPKDIGQVISSTLAAIRRKVSPDAASRLQRALAQVTTAEIRRWAEAETGGAK